MNNFWRRGFCVLLFAVSAQLAAGEEVLRLLIWEGHAPAERIEAFEKLIEEKYGAKIRLQISYMDGTDSYYAAVRNGTVDLVMLTHDLFKDERFNFINNKLLLPLDLANIPNFKSVKPSLRKADYLTSQGDVYGVPESQGPYALAYNTALLEDAPVSWNTLWDPRLKGKYVIGGHEYVYNALITALALGYSTESLGSYDALNNSEFKDKLRQLVVNAHSFWIGVDTAEDLSGHSLAVIWGDSLKPLRQLGEHWAIAEPMEGTPYWIDNCAITSALADKPFLKKVAEEYINYLLTPDYQVNHILRVISTTPVITDFEHLLTAEEKDRLNVTVSGSAHPPRILLPTCSRRDRNGLKILWEEAMEGILDGTGASK